MQLQEGLCQVLQILSLLDWPCCPRSSFHRFKMVLKAVGPSDLHPQSGDLCHFPDQNHAAALELGRLVNSSGAKQTLEVEFQDSDSATKALLKLMGQKMDNSGQQGQQSPAQSNSSSVEPVETTSQCTEKNAAVESYQCKRWRVGK